VVNPCPALNSIVSADISLGCNPNLGGPSVQPADAGAPGATPPASPDGSTLGPVESDQPSAPTNIPQGASPDTMNALQNGANQGANTPLTPNNSTQVADGSNPAVASDAPQGAVAANPTTGTTAPATIGQATGGPPTAAAPAGTDAAGAPNPAAGAWGNDPYGDPNTYDPKGAYGNCNGGGGGQACADAIKKMLDNGDGALPANPFANGSAVGVDGYESNELPGNIMGFGGTAPAGYEQIASGQYVKTSTINDLFPPTAGVPTNPQSVGIYPDANGNPTWRQVTPATTTTPVDNSQQQEQTPAVTTTPTGGGSNLNDSAFSNIGGSGAPAQAVGPHHN
jgi:hypothetical protein